MEVIFFDANYYIFLNIKTLSLAIILLNSLWTNHENHHGIMSETDPLELANKRYSIGNFS